MAGHRSITDKTVALNLTNESVSYRIRKLERTRASPIRTTTISPDYEHLKQQTPNTALKSRDALCRSHTRIQVEKMNQFGLNPKSND